MLSRSLCAALPAALIVTIGIAVPMATAIPASANITSCRVTQVRESPPTMTIKVSHAACREVLGTRYAEPSTGSLADRLEAKDSRGFGKHFWVTARYSTAAQEAEEEHSELPTTVAHWQCTSKERRVILSGGHFAQVRIIVRCMHAHQSAEAIFGYRPTAA